RNLLIVLFVFIAGTPGFTQTSQLRDYVGLINQTFHPSVVTYMEKFKAELEKRGYKDAAKSVDTYLKGGTGSGFIYVGPGGKNYIITNHHVISQSYSLSVTFEKSDGAKTKYEGLTILAADEEMDIALLAFSEGQKPFTAGLAFLDRPVEEGETVYSAGFPGLGTIPIWQFGQGIISNATVRFPESEDSEKMMGPYIQHTAQVDPGNSGGPLLIQRTGVPSGYAVVGINTLTSLYRQAANFSIPMDRVRAFLDSALSTTPAEERPRLDERLNSFIEGLGANRAVYDHIAKYLSSDCTALNAGFAIDEMLRSAPRLVQNNIIEAFYYSPVEGMNYAVAWTIENALRSKTGKIVIELDSVTPNVKKGYNITFKVNGGTMNSEWINEYGIWRIGSFGEFAAGDKSYVDKKEKERKDAQNVRTKPDFQFSVGYANILNLSSAVALDFKFRGAYQGYGLRTYIGGEAYFQLEGLTGFYFPIKLGNTALTPYVDIGAGVIVQKSQPSSGSLEYDEPLSVFKIALSFQPGLMFTTAAVPGLYLQAAYQYNLAFGFFDFGGSNNPHVISVGVGYCF
ncbi:MAG: serine protease, partial [Treponema sp.]|nr:serine protease [Treponema sp.]